MKLTNKLRAAAASSASVAALVGGLGLAGPAAAQNAPIRSCTRGRSLATMKLPGVTAISACVGDVIGHDRALMCR